MPNDLDGPPPVPPHDDQRSLGRLEAKVDMILVDLRGLRQEYKEVVGRIEKLEHQTTFVKGLSVAVGAISAVVVSLFWKLVEHFK